MQTTLSISLYTLIALFYYGYGTYANTIIEKSVYSWVEIEEWSSCSTSCGDGGQQKRLICIKSFLYTETAVSNDFCESIIKPNQLIKICNLGECGDIYFWKPSKWSECSQTCGNSGRKTRDVECVYDEGNGKLVPSSFQFCQHISRPEASSPCNNLDCPPKFIPGKWEKCIKSRGCLPGKQRRSLDCIGLLKTGKTKQMPRNACYKETIPPVSWRKCYDHINTKECLKSNKRLPEIETKHNTLVQMRKTKSLKIQIGQNASVFLFTRIIINCPVNYFLSRDILWKHNAITYKFHNNTKRRIRVDKKGRLKINKIKTEDQGLWTCVAGSTNASTYLTCRNPSDGYHDWVLRTALWNREMLNEDPNIGLVRQEVVQWIQKSWSACSISCGGEGIQTREVHCEEIDTRHYNIMSDEVCEKRGQKKPDMKRICVRESQCPKWLFQDYDMNKCTDKCLRIGGAQVEGKLSCIFQEKEINVNSCDKEKVPPIDCPNQNCQVAWKKSKWSKCSVSCGGNGIMARYLMCIWKNTGLPAGSLCYREKLFVPKVIKPCTAPKCNLKCIDLSSSCQKREKFCKITLYRYTCCNSCYQVYHQSISKMNKDSSKNLKKIKNKNRKYRKIRKIIGKKNVSDAN